MPYKTEMGQSICIVGSIGQLGNWKDFKAHLKWNEGHVWRLENVSIPAQQGVFQYKYVVLENGKPSRWEQGFNRIADLKLLSIQNNGTSQLQLFDQFDRYFVNFTMYYPLKSTEYMKINGDPPELGFWQKGLGPIEMKEATDEIVWLTGEKVRPWEFYVKFKQGECPSKIIYKYLIRDD